MTLDFVTPHFGAYKTRPPQAWKHTQQTHSTSASSFFSALGFFLLVVVGFSSFGNRGKALVQVRRKRYSIVLVCHCTSLYPGRQTFVEASGTYRGGWIYFKESVSHVPRWSSFSVVSLELRLNLSVIFSLYYIWISLVRCLCFIYNF